MNIPKKPPDKFITIKYVLDKIIINDKPDCELKKDNIKTILNDTCFRTNQIVIHTYQFLRLWILNKYHTCENNKVPVYSIQNSLRLGHFKIFKESKFLQKNASFALKISGIWENAKNYGLSYKIIDAVHLS